MRDKQTRGTGDANNVNPDLPKTRTAQRNLTAVVKTLRLENRKLRRRIEARRSLLDQLLGIACAADN